MVILLLAYIAELTVIPTDVVASATKLAVVVLIYPEAGVQPDVPHP